MSGTASFLLGAIAGVLVCAVAVVAWMLARRRREPTEPNSETERQADLTSKIAHELKNPVMSVKGLASTGIRLYDSMSDGERLEFFRLIDVEAARLKLVAEQISTALKIEAGRLTYDIRDEDLGKLVQEVAWRTSVGDHAVVVEADEGLVVPVDRARFAEVLTNLIDNASKFSPPDAPIEVRVYRAEDHGATVEVSDRGPGIPPEKREAVFGRFAEWRPAGYEETPGAGLGLFICRAHVLAHGGRIEIEDEPERGTMLRVTLPAGG